MNSCLLRDLLKKIRSIGTFYVAEKTLEFVRAIRLYELEGVLGLLPSEGKLLEIGAGTGWQANEFDARGYDVSAIDLPSSDYRENRVWDVAEYNGKNIPFKDDTFDIVFSSNVLEHIPHVYEFQNEIHRVLKPDGYALHILPSSSWRFWTNITCLLKNWMPPAVHGEHAKNSLSEIYYFSCRWWRRLFDDTGWVVVTQKSSGLFYTGSLIMDSRLSIETRVRMSRFLGSSCNIFVLRKQFSECQSVILGDHSE